MHGLSIYIMIFKVFNVHEVSFAFPLKHFTKLLNVIIGRFTTFRMLCCPSSRAFLMHSSHLVKTPKVNWQPTFFTRLMSYGNINIKNSFQIRKRHRNVRNMKDHRQYFPKEDHCCRLVFEGMSGCF